MKRSFATNHGAIFGIGVGNMEIPSGIQNISSSLKTICKIGPDGQVQIHTIGSTINELPITVLSPQSQAIIGRLTKTVKALDEKANAMEEMRQEYTHLRARLDLEPTLLQDDIVDLFPQYIGSSIQIRRKGNDDGFYLEVNGVAMDDHVPMDSGERFFLQQKELTEVQERAYTLESKWESDAIWFEAKKALFPVLAKNLTASLVTNDPETAMKIETITFDEHGEFTILVREPVNETSDCLPEGMAEIILGMAKMDPNMQGNLSRLKALLQPSGNGKAVPELTAGTETGN